MHEEVSRFHSFQLGYPISLPCVPIAILTVGAKSMSPVQFL